MATKLAQILADFTTSLASELVVGGTTATLSAAVDDDGVALPSGRYFFTLDNSNTSKEHISCDLVGTALTNIKSVSRQGVETTGTVRKHRIGATVTLTDFGSIKFMNDILKGTTQLDVNAPLGYDGAPGTLTGNQLATVTYVLGVVNGGAVTFDQQIISNQTSGEAIAVNDVVYFKEADAKWYKADADLTATFDQLQIGICKTVAGASGVTIQVAISGPVSGFIGLTAGAKYYLSNTAGAITTTAGTNSVFIGWALTSTTLLFNPILKTLPSQKEKDALVGSQGVPGTTNKYVTSDNVYTAETDQTQTTQNATVEVGEANATTKKNKVAQSFIPAKTKIRGVNLYKSADTGTFTGTVTVSLQADTSGSPSGSDLATVTLSNANWIALAVGEFSAIFTTEYTSMTAGSLYWLVVTTSTSDTTNHPNVGTNSAGGYASGSVKYNNTTDGWTTVSTIELYFKTLQGVNNQIGVSPFVQTFTTSSTWVKPTSTLPFKVLVECWGGGGSGGRGGGASGGGGGAYNQAWIDSSSLSSTETITIGAGGLAKSSNSNGDSGGTTSFGSKVFAYGGGGGGGSNSSGGGGGGVLSAGATAGNGGSPSMNIAGGFGYCPAGTAASGIGNAFGGGGGGGYNGGNGGGGGSSYFGGGGGTSGANGWQGGNSVYGGGGGCAASATDLVGTSIFGGNGGLGATSGTGGTGVTPSGGGGASGSGTSGAGGAGQVKVTLFF